MASTSKWPTASFQILVDAFRLRQVHPAARSWAGEHHRGETIGDRVVNNVPPEGIDIAMVFQNYALYPHMTVRDNMAFSLLLAKAPKQVIDEKVARGPPSWALTLHSARFPRQLSGGGSAWRWAGRCATRRSSCSMSRSTSIAAWPCAPRCRPGPAPRRRKTTTIYVTHDQIEAMTMADKIVVMNSGNVEQFGVLLESHDRLANLFVAGFIGLPASSISSTAASNRARSRLVALPCRCRRTSPTEPRATPSTASGRSICGSTPRAWRRRSRSSSRPGRRPR